jgi:hypothetical protein
VLLIASRTRAQSPPATSDPAADVDHALGSEHAVLRRSQHYTGAAHHWALPLSTTRGECYEVIGLARGSSRVGLEIHARNARVGDVVPLASSRNDVVRTRFCASLPGHVYSLALDSEGPTHWAVAVHAVPPDEPSPEPGAASRERLALALASSSGSSPQPSGNTADAGAGDAATSASYPIGGTEADYVGSQIRSVLSGRTAVGIIPAVRVNLATAQSSDVDLPLTGGHCIQLIAAGVPSVSDLVVEIVDPAGNRVAQDNTHRPTESVSYCPSYSGTYRASVRMLSGFGLTGIQAFEVH